MPSRDKNVKKKPTAKPRGGLYKPGEEIKPQKRGSIFKGFPKVESTLKDVNRGIASKESSMRREVRNTYTEEIDRKKGRVTISDRMKYHRAAGLYTSHLQDAKDLQGVRDNLNKDLVNKGLNKIGRNLNRLKKFLKPYDVSNAKKYLASHRVPKVKSPASPAGMIIGLGLEGYKRDKSSKQIKKLRKKAVPV